MLSAIIKLHNVRKYEYGCQGRIYKSAELWQSSGTMAGKSAVRIKVLKKLNSEEIFGDNPPLGENVKACPVYEIGQEFIVGEDGEMPDGFCHWAWNDLYKVVTALRYGVNWEPDATKKGAPTVQCCTDGLRPVIFKLERV